MPPKCAPFDSQGNLMHYAEEVLGRPFVTREMLESDGHRAPYSVAHEWRTNLPVELTLKIAGFGRGRSAAYFEWEDEEGHTYPMFMADMVDLLKRGHIENGVTSQHWEYSKRGKNYGIKLAKMK